MLKQQLEAGAVLLHDIGAVLRTGVVCGLGRRALLVREHNQAIFRQLRLSDWVVHGQWQVSDLLRIAAIGSRDPCLGRTSSIGHKDDPTVGRPRRHGPSVRTLSTMENFGTWPGA